MICLVHIFKKQKGYNMNTLTRSCSKSIVCICPKCRKTYKRRMFWTGRDTPKMFCNNCKSIVGRYNNELYVVDEEEASKSLIQNENVTEE